MLKRLLPVAIIALAIGLAVIMVQSRSGPSQTSDEPTTALVEVMPVTYRDAAISVPSQGNVQARTRTSLVAEVSGQAIDVSPRFVAGGFFQQGERLLQLDDQNHRAALSRAQASVAAAKSQLEQERGQADVARREWERMNDTQRNSIRARELYLRQPQLQEAEASLASAEAELAQARRDLDKTRIIAPYDGLVVERAVDLGQFINSGTTLGEIFAVDYAEVRLPIPESRIDFLDLPGLRLSDKPAEASDQPLVTLSSRIAGREQHWQGRMMRTEGVVDTRTRVLFSVVQIEDPYGIHRNDDKPPLRIGTFVNARISGRPLEDVVVLPRHVVQARDQVWVVDAEQRLRTRQVEVITMNGDEAYIGQGLQENDLIVITRMESPLPGMRVETREVAAYGN